MNGIRVYFHDSDEAKSGFELAFQPIYPFFSGLFFVESSYEVAEGLFDFPYDEAETLRDQVLSTSVDSDGNRFLFRSDSLIQFERYVRDDWNSVVLTDIADLRLNANLANRIRAGRNESVASRLLFFHNYDGAFWQCFTNVDGVSDALVESRLRDETLDLRRVIYSEDYPDPGVYRTNYPPPIRTRYRDRDL